MDKMSKPSPKFPIEREDIERVIYRLYHEGHEFDIIGPQIAWEMRTFGDEIVEAVCEFWCQVILYNNLDVMPSMQLAESSRRSRIKHAEYWLAAVDTILKEELTPLQAAAWSNLQHSLLGTLFENLRKNLDWPSGTRSE